MKREELEALGLSKEQIDGVLNAHHKELEKAQNDLKVEQEKTSTQTQTIEDLKKSLDGFKDIDVSALKKQIADLEQDIKTKEDAHAKAIADRDFNDILKDAIAGVKGKNSKAITALLDLDALKASNNQKEDIANALKALTEAEDSKMLFGESEPQKIGTGNPIGNVVKTMGDGDDLSAMRKAMGLPENKN